MTKSLLKGDIALITCVQNKAVDSIAEKLGKTDDVKFFVVGNEDRLQLISKEWTLKNQVDRDGEVVALEKIMINTLKLQDTINEAISFHSNRKFFSKERKHNRIYNARRLFPSDEDALQKWVDRDLWRIWWLNNVKKR